MASQSDLYSAAIDQGLTPARAKIAAAVGMGESGGNTSAHNTDASTGDNSYGAWQINMLGDMGPTRRVLFGISSNEQLFDLETNARAMKILSASGADFSPWSAFKNGSYQKFMGAAVTDRTGEPDWKKYLSALSPAFAVGSTGGIADASQNLGSLVETVNKGSRWLSNSENWLRIVYVVGGGILTLAGLQMMVSGNGAPLKTAMNIVPAGRVANLAKVVKK